MAPADMAPPVLTLWLVEDEPAYQDAFARLVASTDDLRLGETFSSYAALNDRLLSLSGGLFS